MAQVPAEAVEFARMVVRAFYPLEYAVVVDGVLRKNNFCSHADLALSLRMQPKELRQILTRMVSARLMCHDKLKQRRINYKDDKRPSRVVQTEFWYVPLQDLIDAFQFRVDKISRELDEKIRKESEQDLYQCERCLRRYKLVDILANVDAETGVFYCDAITDTRRDCGGIITEEDNSSRLKDVENFKKRFEEELQPLRALAVRCLGVEIPRHPLEGADKETWDLYVPETIGLRGEVVDEEGLNSELAAEVNGPKLDTSVHAFEGKNGGSLGGDATVIPDRPDWFKDGGKGDDDDEDDWEDNEATTAAGAAARAKPSFGTGAMLGADNEADAKSYVDSYMKAMGGDQDIAGESGEGDGGAAGVAASATDGKEDDGAVAAGDDGAAAGVAPPAAGEAGAGEAGAGEAGAGAAGAGAAGAVEAGALEAAGGGGEVEEDGAATAAAGEEEEAAEKEDPALDVVVLVQGAEYKMRDITPDLAEQMTPEEFQQYCELRPMDDDDDDDDIEFE